ncbi:TonB-dependent receptor plug domain-containing protein [Brevundimonas balnearis]|uniref:TonB-dependent receptor plug domain-containing protein n=1 Tax=Brevundimonas balnearis TaxID=1572858 RepID=A0ABV6QZD8_9CAUL
MTHRTSKRAALLVSAASCVLASVAQAQTPAAQDPVATVDEVVVTGSRTAQRSRLETASPVDVLTDEQITQAAAVGGELGYALQVLAPSFNFPRQSNSGPADVVRAAQLRGLSPDQTLVLVNGRRRHTTAIVNLESKIGKGTTPVDFNAIPASAVGRIEILRDGAGAQYGSDAIAGVVNVRLNDSRVTGGRFSATYGAHVTDFEPFDDEITDGETLVLTGDYGWGLDGGGFFRFGGEHKTREETERGGPGVLPFFEDQTADNLALEGQSLFRAGDPEVEQLSGWFNTEVPLSERSSLYAFGTFDDREGRGTGFFRFPDSSGNIRDIYPDGYRPITVVDSTDVQLAGGWRTVAAGWDLDLGLNYGVSEYDFGLENSLNASLGAASPTSFDLGDYRTDLLAANLDVTRGFAVSGLASPVSVAAGLEVRRETFETGAGDPACYAAGPLTDRPANSQAAPGLRPEDTVDIDRDVWGAYVEVSADLTDRLFVDASAPFEDYSDFGDAVAGKLAARYALTDAVALRGSVSNSFRAPSLSQTGFQSAVSDRGAGGALVTVRTVPPGSAIGQALGAEPLQAEESLSFTGGVVFNLGTNLSLTIDAHRVDVDDRITLSRRVEGDDVATFIEAQTGIAGVTAVNLFTNAVDTRTEGVDVVASWRTDLAGGLLSLQGAYSWAETEIRSVDAPSAQFQSLGFGTDLIGLEERNTLEDAAPKSKVSLAADWTRGPLRLSSRITHYGETTRVFDFGGGFAPAQTYGAETQVDVEAEYDFGESYSVAVGANNLLDEYPDESSADIGYFGNFPYDVLSPIGFNGRYVYARVTARF